LKLGDLKGALYDADFAIRDDEDNVKALFRQGQVGIFHCLGASSSSIEL
jgi:peptidyl-prolyl isomerase D